MLASMSMAVAAKSPYLLRRPSRLRSQSRVACSKTQVDFYLAGLSAPTGKRRSRNTAGSDKSSDAECQSAMTQGMMGHYCSAHFSHRKKHKTGKSFSSTPPAPDRCSYVQQLD